MLRCGAGPLVLGAPRSSRRASGLAAKVAAFGLTLTACGALGVSCAQASTQDALSIFAGTSSYGTPTPGPATSSALGAPLDLALDSSGNVFIADEDADVIEKVTPSGTLSIIAGNGNYGPATPGPATSSDLGGPVAVAVDAAGDVYIADSSNNQIEKVTPGGVLSVVAGTGSQGPPTAGPAKNSDLDYPYALAVGPAGDLYIDDEDNSVVEKVTPGGTLSIFAGTGSQSPAVPGPATNSGMGDVRGIATDAAGDLYVADDYNAMIEKITPTGSLSIIAGDGTYGAETPGPALSSMLANPCGMAIDPAGDLYVADSGNEVVEEITPTGILSVVAGTGNAGQPTAGPPLSSDMYEPTSVVLDPAGDAYYIDDYGNSDVEKVAPPPPTLTTAPSISGTVALGHTLTASDGSWSSAPTGYSFQWQECDATGANCTDISGATSGTYTVVAGDVGHTIRVVVTAENGGGSSVESSEATVVVPSPAPPTPAPTPPLATLCPTPTGQLSATKIGQVGLGQTRGQMRQLLPRFGVYNYYTDNYCLNDGPGVRVGYASARLLGPASTAAAMSGDVALALTANPFYALDGVRHGTRLATAAEHLKLGKVLHIGLNDWYVIAGTHSNGILKVRHNVVIGVGIANRQLTGTRSAQQQLLSHF